MKKSFKLLGIILVVVFLVSCSKEVQMEEDRILYSNISDDNSLNEVKLYLEKAEIADERIDKFISQVIDYNDTIDYTSLTRSGFEELKDMDEKYNTVKMMDLWEDKKGLFIGNNCRMTTFNLLEDLIDISLDQQANAKNLFMDLDAIENDPEGAWSKERISKFKVLYGSIETEDSKDIDLHIKKLKEEFNNRGIKFKEDSKASNIAVVFHDTLDSMLFIGHTGVLIDLDEELIFIEKLNFSEPYQAIKFKDRLELNDYLMNKYDLSYNQPEAKPFIMENDELMEDYRPNQNNLED